MKDITIDNGGAEFTEKLKSPFASEMVPMTFPLTTILTPTRASLLPLSLTFPEMEVDCPHAV
jgi:hypothetical protein